MAFASFISSSVRNRCCTARLSHGFSEEPISQICCHEQAINSKPSGLGHFDCANCTSEPNFAKIFTVWRRLHILNSIQVFIVCALSAAMLATGFAIRAVLHERTGVFRDLWWPHQFDPLVIFGAAFLAVLLVLLAYWHLGRLGVLAMLVFSFATYYGMVFCAVYLFFGGKWFGVVGYSVVLGLFFVFLYISHVMATASRKIEEAQRRLGLRPVP